MKVGDAVRMNPNAANRVGMPQAANIALVVDVEPAWPSDPYEDTLRVVVSYPDGRGAVWFDWQLEVIAE